MSLGNGGGGGDDDCSWDVLYERRINKRKKMRASENILGSRVAGVEMSEF